MKTSLQIRAESLAGDFKRKGRKPIVIEFAGTPKAGKTTTLSAVNAFLKRCGFKVEVVVERASVCPIRDKKHSNFNVWTACTTLAQILEKTQIPPRVDDPEILILDRGLFDSIAWLEMMERLARIRREERETVERFLLLPDWRKRISGVIVMTASPGDAMKREQGDLPVEGATGSIMNDAVLERFRANTQAACSRLGRFFRIFEVNTSLPGSDKKKTAEKVAGIVLDLISDQLEEEILCINKAEAQKIFQEKSSVTGAKASELVNLFVNQGSYIPRAEAEASVEMLQALPVVVVRTKGGQVLRLRRREKQEDNALHERLVIWAGGHVRREDAANGQSILQGVIRELHEELRLSLEAQSLNLLGAIHVDRGGSTARHIALVYEWRAETDDVTVVLSNAEFFERRGTSLSGKFVPLEELRELQNFSDKLEPWSEQIIRDLLDGGDHLAEMKLL
ncbi:MAG: NUDIX domain-containing protein [Verrucomicrobia bacterium]|nr:NUDIX domain-containing protein [Verrucomicrobiota bacterium]MDE3098814.1 NUDIX domain-containing protein [Verrucomicrobiota bacterium]